MHENSAEIPVAERLFNLDTYNANNGNPVNVFTSLYLTHVVGMNKTEYYQVKSNNCLCCGRESGFILLSKTGFLRHIDEIENRFVFLQKNPSDRGYSPIGTWQDYKRDVMNLYDEIIKESKKHANSLNKKVNDLQNKIKQHEIDEHKVDEYKEQLPPKE